MKKLIKILHIAAISLFSLALVFYLLGSATNPGFIILGCIAEIAAWVITYILQPEQPKESD
jgi:hypothetical protein